MALHIFSKLDTFTLAYLNILTIVNPKLILKKTKNQNNSKETEKYSIFSPRKVVFLLDLFIVQNIMNMPMWYVDNLSFNFTVIQSICSMSCTSVVCK